ncbi:solute carrier organic anion transporter family member 1B3-like [Ctenodactylus gundi]
MFLAALSFSYVCKALGAILMKSSITQIERRFDIPSSIAGVIDGGFEMGNLFVIVFVSYFGSKLHRPKVIGIGCVVMGVGSILTALPHFFMGRYRYSTGTHVNSSESSLSTCLINQTLSLTATSPGIEDKGCKKESESYMWIYVLLGNMLRGIGETPIVPLGVSYIDDFAKKGQSSVYLGTLHAITMIGPILGFVMSSLFAKMYVDIGYVDLSTIRITPQDARWVGAWWLGFLVSGLLSIICSMPFFFLPKNPYKPRKERKVSASLHGLKTNEEISQTANLTNRRHSVAVNMTGFLQSMKRLLTDRLYILYLVLTVTQISSYIGAFTYLFKFIEQQFGQSASEANFTLGLITLPFMATGTLLGGYLIKKLKLTVVGIAKFSLFTSLIAFIFHMSYFAAVCESKSVAGLTLSYDGINPVTSPMDVPLSYCNSDCNCDNRQWEPVCGNNGIIYLSPCLAGCKSTGGFTDRVNMAYDKKNFQRFWADLWEDGGAVEQNGEKPGKSRWEETEKQSPGQSLSVQPELKSLAMGFHSLAIRTLGGILSPIYFGALIDRTCLKWSTTSCGSRGACRLYDSKFFGYTYLGLVAALKFLALIIYAVTIYTVKKKFDGKDAKTLENEGKVTNEEKIESLNKNEYFEPSSATCTSNGKPNKQACEFVRKDLRHKEADITTLGRVPKD